ncbi:MAG: hypothetical protein Q7T82_14315 [Armatimonadota bacterium]|nr:hypothetical protein [Armatimonadota bacterium]
MNDGPRWPSRRFVIAAVVATVITTAAIVLPDITLPFRDPAEAAYVRGWIPRQEGKNFLLALTEYDEKASAHHFRTAFRLNPHVLRYQLSLAQSLHYDQAALEELLKDGHLLSEARASAEYYLALCWVRKGLWRDWSLATNGAPKLAIALDHLDIAIGLDPTNAAPLYARARVLYVLGRDEEAARSVAEGNTKSSFQKIILHPVFGRSLACSFYIDDLSKFAGHRQLAREQVDYAKGLLRQKQTVRGRRALEDVVVFGKRQAAASPKGILSYLVGRSAFRLAHPELVRLYDKASPER